MFFFFPFCRNSFLKTLEHETFLETLLEGRFWVWWSFSLKRTFLIFFFLSFLQEWLFGATELWNSFWISSWKVGFKWGGFFFKKKNITNVLISFFSLKKRILLMFLFLSFCRNGFLKPLDYGILLKSALGRQVLNRVNFFLKKKHF